YRASDSLTNSGIATVSITVTPLNDPPVAVDDVTNTVEDVSVTISVLVNDSDVDGNPLTILAVNGTNGTLNIAGTNVVYTPTNNFNGTNVFTYTIIDGQGGTNSATVTVTVTGANDAPVAVNDSYSTPEDTALIVPASGVLTNDTDVDGDALNAVLVLGP